MGLFSILPSTQAYERRRDLYKTMYARYHDIKKSTDFIRYQALKAYVQSPEYQSELAHIRSLSYANSKERLLERRWKELRRYREVRKFRKSGVDSDAEYVKEYIELDDKITSPSFLQHKAYLKNKKRHLQSDQYRRYVEYKRLAKSNYIKQYYKIQQKYAAVFAEMEQWRVSFADDFHGKQLAAPWDTKPYWCRDVLAQTYSHNHEEHQLSDGKNVALSGDTVQIATRREAAAGVAWDETMGFIPREFSYTSGMISTAHRLEMRYGRLEAKLSFPDVKNVYGVFWLGCAKKTPAIDLAHYCNKRLVMGACVADKATTLVKKVTLRAGHFYIFQLERTHSTLTWRINGKKIFACANPTERPLYIAFASGVIGKTNDRRLPATFEIDYVQVEEKK